MQYDVIIAHLENRVRSINRALRALSALSNATGRRRLSAATRRRMSVAQRKRWAKA